MNCPVCGRQIKAHADSPDLIEPTHVCTDSPRPGSLWLLLPWATVAMILLLFLFVVG